MTGVITHVTHRVITVNWSSSIISDIKDGKRVLASWKMGQLTVKTLSQCTCSWIQHRVFGLYTLWLVYSLVRAKYINVYTILV